MATAARNQNWASGPQEAENSEDNSENQAGAA